MSYQINGVEIKEPIDTIGGEVAVLSSNGRTAFWQQPSGGFSYPDGTVPSGSIDGSNLTFTLPAIPTSTVFLFLNGLLMIRSINYTLTNETVTFITPTPQTGDILIAF